MTWAVHCADVLSWCEEYEGEPFHCILTDPPYGLSDTPDMTEVLTHWLNDDDYEHGTGGFMSARWDSFVPGPKYWRALRRVCHPGAYLFAFGGTRTADLLSVAIRLGGWERFDSIDSISWVQGAGFPKSLNLGKAIDSACGAEREVVGTKLGQPGYSLANNGRTNKIYGDLHNPDGECAIEAPATPLAAAWNGHGTAAKPAHEPVLCFRAPLAKVPSDRIHAVTGWDWWHSEKLLTDTPQTRLKMLEKHGCRLPPLYGDSDLVQITRKALHEGVETDKLFVARSKRQWREAPTAPVTLARVDVKAYRRWSSKTYAANCLSTGAGALWIDGSRVATGERPLRSKDADLPSNGIYGEGLNGSHASGTTTQGRWPPNVCLTHVPPRPDGHGGWLPGCERLGVKRVRPGNGSGVCSGQTSGNKSMFGAKSYPLTYAAPDGTEAVDDWACVDGCAVRALSEQSIGIHSAGNKKPPGGWSDTEATWGTYGQGEHSGARYGDKGTAARFYPQHTWQHEIAERLAGVVPFRYVAKAGRRERDQGLEGLPKDKPRVYMGSSGRTFKDGEWQETHSEPQKRRNPHPTVKPIALTKWLATLILPPPEYAPRRILCPFGGVMSEAIGAVLAGWDEVEAIEMEEEYIPIGEARLRFWADWAARGYDDPATILKAAKQEDEIFEAAKEMILEEEAQLELEL